MINIRKSEDRGHANHGWLDTYHSFSFAHYYDPNYMGFRSLRVINEDKILGGGGFGTHGHKDMEIITYVLEGALEHRDNIGGGSIIKPGEIQRMSAGTGILHSEYNNSATSPVHLLQIWLLPNEIGLTPSYEQTQTKVGKEPNRLHLIAGPEDSEGAVQINQNVNLYAGSLDRGQTLSYQLDRNRHAWLQVARGTIDLNGISLKAGDGAAISQETDLRITVREKAEILLFDLN